MAKRSHAIILSPDAERDIDDIWDYLTTEASIRVADKTVRAIARACRILEKHPVAGRSRDNLISGLRSVLSHPYVVFYRVSAADVQIVRVLHQRRDLEAIFTDENDR